MAHRYLPSDLKQLKVAGTFENLLLFAGMTLGIRNHPSTYTPPASYG